MVRLRQDTNNKMDVSILVDSYDAEAEAHVVCPIQEDEEPKPLHPALRPEMWKITPSQEYRDAQQMYRSRMKRQTAVVVAPGEKYAQDSGGFRQKPTSRPLTPSGPTFSRDLSSSGRRRISDVTFADSMEQEYPKCRSVDSDYESGFISGGNSRPMSSRSTGLQTFGSSSNLSYFSGQTTYGSSHVGDEVTFDDSYASSSQLKMYPSDFTVADQRKFHRPSAYLRGRQDPAKVTKRKQSHKVPNALCPQSRYTRGAQKTEKSVKVIQGQNMTKPRWCPPPGQAPPVKKKDAATECEIIKMVDKLDIGVQCSPEMRTVGTQLPRKTKVASTQTSIKTRNCRVQVGHKTYSTAETQCGPPPHRNVATMTQVKVVYPECMTYLE